MWKRLPKWARQMVFGLALGLFAVGLRQAALVLFPAPEPSEQVMSSSGPSPAELDESPFTKASIAKGRSVTDSYRFVDQDGKPFDIADWYDKPMVVGFIFTSCEEVCPAMNVALKRIVGSMEKAALGEDFRILMVGFDTERDTPKALKKFGSKYTDDFENYRFVSGDPAEVKRLADRLGVAYKAAPPGSPAGWLHFVGMTIVANNSVYHQVYGPAPLPEEILKPVMEAQGKEYRPPERSTAKQKMPVNPRK